MKFLSIIASLLLVAAMAFPGGRMMAQNTVTIPGNAGDGGGGASIYVLMAGSKGTYCCCPGSQNCGAACCGHC